MEDRAAGLDVGREEGWIGDVADDDPHSVEAGRGLLRGDRVEDHELVDALLAAGRACERAELEQPARQPAPDESAATGDDDLHRASSSLESPVRASSICAGS